MNCLTVAFTTLTSDDKYIVCDYCNTEHWYRDLEWVAEVDLLAFWYCDNCANDGDLEHIDISNATIGKDRMAYDKDDESDFRMQQQARAQESDKMVKCSGRPFMAKPDSLLPRNFLKCGHCTEKALKELVIHVDDVDYGRQWFCDDCYVGGSLLEYDVDQISVGT